MKLSKALGLKGREVVSFIGGGGKTTLMFRLAGEIPVQCRVIITTTTKIYLPTPDRHPTLFLGKGDPPGKDLEGFLKAGTRPVLCSELLEDNKVKGISPGQLSLLQGYADYILVEADGSRGLSLKGHLDHEPVIPRSTTLVVIVIGADIIGKTLCPQHVHRPGVVSERTGREMGAVIDAGMIAGLINHAEGPLRHCPPGARIVSFINKIDRLKDHTEIYRLGSLLLGEKISRVVLGTATGENPALDILEYRDGAGI